MVLKIFQKGFNYSQDGQGNRLVYHLQGCNMKCRWCANPEGMPAGGAMIREKDKSPRLSYEEHPVDEVYEEILSCKPMFFDGGGVTFSGGEATMQFEALKELLKRLKEAGIHTAIETNGTHARLEELFPYVDQLIMDCKHWGSETLPYPPAFQEKPQPRHCSLHNPGPLYPFRSSAAGLQYNRD